MFLYYFSNKKGKNALVININMHAKSIFKSVIRFFPYTSEVSKDKTKNE